MAGELDSSVIRLQNARQHLMQPHQLLLLSKVLCGHVSQLKSSVSAGTAVISKIREALLARGTYGIRGVARIFRYGVACNGV